MGDETHCIATWNGKRSVGAALLETEDLVFRGEFRLRIAFASVLEIDVQGGSLSLKVAEGTATFNLGERAGRWADRIRNPKGLLDKLGIKPGMTVSVVGLDEPWFLEELRARVEGVRVGKPARNSDVIVAAVSTVQDLLRLATLPGSLKKDGALWTVRPKGSPEVSEAILAHAARQAGLVDVKVARFSDTHTAEKFVRPKLAR
jgi:hypothetical protein